MSTPLTIYRTQVLPEWVDYNGHMNDACYCIAFSRGVDTLMEYIGIDTAYRERSGYTLYTMETHVCYLLEVSEGAPLRVDVQLLDSDAKRLRVFFTLVHDDTGALLATSEQLLMSIDQAGPSAAPFQPEIAERIAALAAAHADLPVPTQAGRAIGIRRR